MNQYIKHYVEIGRLTKANMHVRKAEFATEVLLSLFIVVMTLEQSADPTYSVGAIAVIHSFNLARAFEAYQEAQIETQYQDQNR